MKFDLPCRLIFVCSLFLILLSSCVQIKKVEVDYRLKDIDKYLAAGEFQKALDTYRITYERYPADQQLVRDYIKTVEVIKTAADKSFEQEDFTLSERTYRILLDNYSDFKDFARSLSFDRGYLTIRIKNCRINIIKGQIKEYMEAGDYQKILAFYKIIQADYPADKALSRMYVDTVESIKNKANMAFEGRDYVSAGKLYRILFDNYPDFRPFAHLLSFDSESLVAKITDCSLILFKSALENYRKGNLTDAIALWENILSYDPENLEAKRAIDTAKTQLESLHEKE